MILSSIIVCELLIMLENIAEQFWPVSSTKGEPWVKRVLRKIQTPDLDTEFAIQASVIKNPTKQTQTNFFFPLWKGCIILKQVPPGCTITCPVSVLCTVLKRGSDGQTVEKKSQTPTKALSASASECIEETRNLTWLWGTSDHKKILSCVVSGLKGPLRVKRKSIKYSAKGGRKRAFWDTVAGTVPSAESQATTL